MSEIPKRPHFFLPERPEATYEAAKRKAMKVVLSDAWAPMEALFAAKRLRLSEKLERCSVDELKAIQAQIKLLDEIICLKEQAKIRREDPGRNGFGHADSEDQDEDHPEERP